MRKNIVLIHLILAALVAPALLLVGVSGGLYLVGQKGQVVSTEILLPSGAELDFSSSSNEKELDELLDQIGVDHEYQYLKISKNMIQTRPTSRTYLEFSNINGVLTLSSNQPDLLKSLIELHKGHGPTAFKTYQKLVAISLLFIVLSGLWLGLTSPVLKQKTLYTASAGLIVFLVLALF